MKRIYFGTSKFVGVNTSDRSNFSDRTPLESLLVLTPFIQRLAPVAAYFYDAGCDFGHKTTEGLHGQPLFLTSELRLASRLDSWADGKKCNFALTGATVTAY